MAQMAKDTSPERTLLAAVCAGLLLCGAAPAGEARLPTSALVLFGAHWCVPCRVEIAQLDPLTAAPETFLNGHVDMTFVGGKLVYSNS